MCIRDRARGYGGSTFVGNADIQSQATGNFDSSNPVPEPRPGGDVIAAAKASHNTTTDTLRPIFPLAPGNAVALSEAQQLRTMMMHDEFGTVAPGSGLGVTNKMFQMNMRREKIINFCEPMDTPRRYDGPSGLVAPGPLEWQNNITKQDRNNYLAREIAADLSGVLLEARAGQGSLNILGDDYGQLTSVSARGLKRPADSPLEPVLRLPGAFENVQIPTGFSLSKRAPRRLFDALRYPDRFTANVAQSGGPTMSVLNSLAQYPFPIGTA